MVGGWSLDSLPRNRNKSIKYLLRNFIEETEEKNLAHQTIEGGKVSFIFHERRLKGLGIARKFSGHLFIKKLKRQQHERWDLRTFRWD